MTEQQTVKKDNQVKSSVILTDRFVHRDNEKYPGGSIFVAEPDEVIAHLAAHFTLNNLNIFALPNRVLGVDSTIDDMPRFQQSLRDGLQVPKEG